MDFKVAGTPSGITALQMDIKIKGITRDILAEALAKAHKARATILGVMLKAIPGPKSDVSPYALKMERFQIPVEKIREVIGSQGKVINDIIAKCGDCSIDINDDGRVIIYHTDREMINKAKAMIDNIVRVAKVGEVFEGKVVRIEAYGCFVNLFGDNDGMCHISRLGWNRVDKVEDVVKLGQTLKVIVTNVDEKGRVDLSHREFLPKPDNYVEPFKATKARFEKKPFHKHDDKHRDATKKEESVPENPSTKNED